MEKKKKKYESPIAYDLTNAVNDEVRAAHCTSGVTASQDCRSGGTATTACKTGNMVPTGGNCQPGIMATGDKCEGGGLATKKCVSGGAA